MATLTKCKVHKTYKAINPPRKTKNFPDGCPDCVAYYKDRNKVAAQESAPKVRKPRLKPVTVKGFDLKKMKVNQDIISDEYEIMYGKRCLYVGNDMDAVHDYLAGFMEGRRFNETAFEV